MDFKLVERESPFAERAAKMALNISGSEDRYGAHSIQIFPSLGANGNLHQTHADARGFMEWYGNWNTGNFWYTDAGVKVWGYEETYDNWQDTYGMDSVAVFYHSGHGGMNNAGVFFAPLGGLWDGRIDAISSDMVIGNEQLKYLFWSTCQSLKVPDIADVNPAGLSPISTWNGPNRGLRMIFGFQSNSVDNPNYGKNFGNNWNAGQKFSEAWINASWAISQNQIPTVCAMGATREESDNILYNERQFQWGAVAKNWYSWRWGGFVRPVFQIADRQEMPKKPEVLLFENSGFDQERIVALSKKLGFSQKELESFGFERNGNIVATGKEKQITVDVEGRITAVLGDTNYKNTTALSQEKAVSMAEKAISEFKFKGDGVDLVFDSLRIDKGQAGTSKGSGTIEDAYITDTTVIFRQVYNGIRSVNNNHGLVMLTYDNDGKLTRIHNSTKKITGVNSRPHAFMNDPIKGQKTNKIDLLSDLNLNENLRLKLVSLDGREFASSRNNSPIGAEIIEAKEGFDFSGPTGELVAQREYSVEKGESNGQSFAKVYKVRVPLFG
jgi:hypothetical protein